MEIGLIIICLVLIASNLFTIWFYQKQIATLVDKAMSRSYPEYVQTKNLEQVDRFPTGNTQDKPDVSDDEVLNELNRILV